MTTPSPTHKEPKTRRVQYTVVVERAAGTIIFKLLGNFPWELAHGPAAGESGELGSLLESLGDAVTEDFDL